MFALVVASNLSFDQDSMEWLPGAKWPKCQMVSIFLSRFIHFLLSLSFSLSAIPISSCAAPSLSCSICVRVSASARVYYYYYDCCCCCCCCNHDDDYDASKYQILLSSWDA